MGDTLWFLLVTSVLATEPPPGAPEKLGDLIVAEFTSAAATEGACETAKTFTLAAMNVPGLVTVAECLELPAGVVEAQGMPANLVFTPGG